MQVSSEEELLRLPVPELARRLRRAEQENMKLMMSHSALVKDINQRMMAQASEAEVAGEARRRLASDNAELRDLCCFLDDDRQKCRKMAREWQRFGRYTAAVMRQEVAAYQAKLRDLESRQQELISDNLELKKLCLCLDEERRDDGDGSSSSTHNDEILSDDPRSLLNAQVLQYIRNLEKKIQDLEEEHLRDMKNKMGNNCYPKSNWPESTSRDPLKLGSPSPLPKPEAVVRAMKVLEVQEHLESDLESEELAEGERALLREMCNMAWRKLGDGPS